MLTATSNSPKPQVQVQTNGWNDCPYVFSACRSRSVRRKRNVSGPSLAALNTAQGLISEDRSPKLDKKSQFSSPRRPPQLPLSASSASSAESACALNQVPSSPTDSIARAEDAEALLSKLLACSSKLSEKQFDYHKSKLLSSDVISSDENKSFLAQILHDFFSKDKSYSQVESSILEFMMIHAGISWCISLKKILANASDFGK